MVLRGISKNSVQLWTPPKVKQKLYPEKKAEGARALMYCTSLSETDLWNLSEKLSLLCASERQVAKPDPSSCVTRSLDIYTGRGTYTWGLTTLEPISSLHKMKLIHLKLFLS